MSNERPTIDQLRQKALQRPEVKEEYDALGPAFKMKGKRIAKLKEASPKQE